MCKPIQQEGTHHEEEVPCVQTALLAMHSKVQSTSTVTQYHAHRLLPTKDSNDVRRHAPGFVLLPAA